MKWYHAPNYQDSGTSFEVVNEKGELVATVELEEDAEEIVKNHNKNLDSG